MRGTCLSLIRQNLLVRYAPLRYMWYLNDVDVTENAPLIT